MTNAGWPGTVIEDMTRLAEKKVPQLNIQKSSHSVRMKSILIKW